MLNWNDDFEAAAAIGEFWAAIGAGALAPKFRDAYNERLRALGLTDEILAPVDGGYPLGTGEQGFTFSWWNLARLIVAQLMPQYLRTTDDDGITPATMEDRPLLESWTSRWDDFTDPSGLAWSGGVGQGTVRPIFPPPNAKRTAPRDIDTISTAGDEGEIVRFVVTASTPSGELVHNGKMFQRRSGAWVERTDIEIFLRRKYRRTIAKTTDPGQEGQRARLVRDGTTPVAEHGLSGRTMVHTSGAWAPDTSGVDPDFIEDWGVPQINDTFGPWILTDLRDALNALEVTVGMTAGSVSPSGQPNYFWTLVKPAHRLKRGDGADSFAKFGDGSTEAAAYADYQTVGPFSNTTAFTYTDTVNGYFNVERNNNYLLTHTTAPNPDGVSRDLQFLLRVEQKTDIGGSPLPPEDSDFAFDAYGDGVLQDKWHIFPRMAIAATTATTFTSATATGETSAAPTPFASGTKQHRMRGYIVSAGGEAVIAKWAFSYSSTSNGPP